MKQLLIPLFLALPLGCFSQIDEVEMEEEPTLEPPERSFIPRPKLYIKDMTEIHVEYMDKHDGFRIIIKGSNQDVIYNNIGSNIQFLSEPLEENSTYFISLYINNHVYSGTYVSL